MRTNAEIEMFWIDAWSDLYEIIKERTNVRCLLPDGEIVEIEKCKQWLQDSAYAGYIPAVKAGWVQGRRGVIVSQEPASNLQ